MVTRSPAAERSWRLIVLAAGITHALIGLTFLVAGRNLVGPVFDNADGIPAVVWGLWALASGVAICWRRTRFAGLCATAAWYALWGTVLALGIIQAGGPFYAVPVYIFLILLHAAFAVTDWLERHQ